MDTTFTHAFIHEADRKYPKIQCQPTARRERRTQNPFAQAVAERVGTEREQQCSQAEKKALPP